MSNDSIFGNRFEMFVFSLYTILEIEVEDKIMFDPYACKDYLE